MCITSPVISSSRRAAKYIRSVFSVISTSTVQSATNDAKPDRFKLGTKAAITRARVQFAK